MQSANPEQQQQEQQQQQEMPKMSASISRLRGNLRNVESSDEIIELERELRKAYVAKELKTQLYEIETDRFVKRVQERQREAKLSKETEEASNNLRLFEKLRNAERTEAYRSDLTSQIKEKESEKRRMTAEARVERETLTLVDELREEREKRLNLAAKSDAADIFRRQNLVLRRMKLIRLAEAAQREKEKRIADELYLDETESREKGAKIEREARVARNEERIASIVELLLNAETRKRDREELLLELTREDARCEIAKRDWMEEIRRGKMRAELAGNLKEQIDLEEECKLRYALRDRMFKEEILKRIEEDERMAKLTAEARRRMRLGYREQLEKLIESRREIREEEARKLKRDETREIRRRETETEMAKEARRELLEKHASNVAAFVDKKSLSLEERRIVEKFVRDK